MPILNSRSSQFIFTFPKKWFYPSIEKDWSAFYQKLPYPYESVSDFMNTTIQSISFPPFAMDVVEQTKMFGKKIDWKNSKPLTDLFTRQVTVNFKQVDGFFNYWVMQQQILEFLDFSQNQEYLNDFVIRILDNDGRLLNSIFFKEILFTSMTEFELNYAQNSPDFKSFSVTFTYNFIEIKSETTGTSIKLVGRP